MINETRIKIRLFSQSGTRTYLVTPACDVFPLHCGAHCIRHMKQENSGSSAYTANVQLLLNLVTTK